MKELEFNQMETIQGGNVVDGACAVIGLTGAGLAARVLIGAALVIPVWGQVVLAVGVIGCTAYKILK